MHPVLVLVPVFVLAIGPRLWVARVLKRHDSEQAAYSGTAGELARELLDRNGLQFVEVEVTDLGDHYDPDAKTVRLRRERFESKSLTAVTTAAHEVGHALQDAAEYQPFLLRKLLAKIARVSGDVGGVLLIAVPATAVLTRNRIPPAVIGTAALTMLGTGLLAQLAALPSELDASFGRALPLLEDGYIETSQAQNARKILFACSLTYVASSLLSILMIWPWLGWRRRRVAAFPRRSRISVGLTAAGSGTLVDAARRRDSSVVRSRIGASPTRIPGVQQDRRVEPRSLMDGPASGSVARVTVGRGPLVPIVRALARPWISLWLRVTGDY